MIREAAVYEMFEPEDGALACVLASYVTLFISASLPEGVGRQLPGSIDLPWLSAMSQMAIHQALVEQTDADKRLRALQLAEINARQYPRLAEALATLGWVYFKFGRLAEAEQALQTATSSGQSSSETAYYLARVLDARGQRDHERPCCTRSSPAPSVIGSSLGPTSATLCSAATPTTHICKKCCSTAGPCQHKSITTQTHSATWITHRLCGFIAMGRAKSGTGRSSTMSRNEAFAPTPSALRSIVSMVSAGTAFEL